MARDTKTYQQFLDRFQRLCGVDLLSDDEKEFALQFFNRNLRFIYRAYEWPFLCPVEERTPDGSDVIAWAQGGETVIGEVLECWETDPLGDSVPRTVPYNLTPDGIQLFSDYSFDPTYVWFRPRLTECDGSVGYTFPYDFFEYVCHASFADWLASNEQTANSGFQRGLAEQIMLEEIDTWSRQQKTKSLRKTLKTHGTQQTRN